jgi:hypothetical protein
LRPIHRIAQDGSNAIREPARRKGLADNRVDLATRLQARGGVRVAGYDNDPNPSSPRVRPKTADQLNAGHDGHHQICHYDIREGVGRNHVKCRLAVASLDDGVALPLEDQPEHKAGTRIIVDDQDLAQSVKHLQSRAGVTIVRRPQRIPTDQNHNHPTSQCGNPLNPRIESISLPTALISRS